MPAIEAVRQEAERIHFSAVELGGNPNDLLGFVRQEAERRGLDVYALHPEDPQLKGGKAVFDCQAGVILFEDAGSDFERAFLIAHELGHVVLEGGGQDIVTKEVEPDRSIEEAPVGIEKVLDYGARERREIRMNLFARELLLPRTTLRRLHIEDGASSVNIATYFEAPLPVVQLQLLDALLIPADNKKDPLPGKTSEVIKPDLSQIEAAEHRNGPFQLEAGPGTGKTRTLVHRIESLLAEGVNPTSILVITFSNKAANELSERLSLSNPSAAAAMWIGTFHAFGLDIIRRFHDKLGLPPDPRLIDKSESIELLEEELPRLPLHHFRNLWNPALDLNDMLSAISRAKDEVINAVEYQSLAQTMADRVADPTEKIRAEKCLEVALLYETYESLMSSNQFIDFGDLVAMPVRLIENDIAVRDALRARHKHILVDEYQDVNRASVRLLKAIAGDGKNLWVVGDARQSIYRFRGASSTSMAEFSKDFPGAKVGPLDVNYRSGQEVIDTFSTFSSTMQASNGALPLRLSAKRGRLEESPEFRVVGSTEDEISAIAAAIEEQHNAGVPYRNQAMLCASNSRLSQIAEGLEARGIPVLHLGSLFERTEIKNLLALISMLTDPYAVGLLRVSTMSSYSMSLQSALQVIEHLKDSNAAALDWRQAHSQLQELDANSQTVLKRLSHLFEGLSTSSTPWKTFARWIIDDLGLAKSVYLDSDPQRQLQGLALWQFLNFCRRQPRGAGFPSVRLLDRIRRLVLLSEDNNLRQMPAAGESIEAIRLMTIHGSKGLEFDTVHIPGMVVSGLPRNNRPPRCLPPDGLIHGSEGLTGLEAIKAEHSEEEECLFFVALSRARNKLFLYASSIQANGNKRNQSKYISTIKHLMDCHSAPPQLNQSALPTPQININWEEIPLWTDNQISLFERCPRRFLYANVFKLGGRRSETAFIKMHNVVREVFDWLKTDHETTNPSESEINERFEKAWQAKGAVGHGYADDYRFIGRRLVDFHLETRRAGALSPVTSIKLDWGEGSILVKPDNVVSNREGQTIVRRIKTGKSRTNVFDDIEYTVLHLAAVQTYGESVQIEVSFLTSETTESMSLSNQKLTNRKKKLMSMIHNVYAGEFPCTKEARTCPSCSYFFICGDLPAGSITKKI